MSHLSICGLFIGSVTQFYMAFVFIKSTADQYWVTEYYPKDGNLLHSRDSNPYIPFDSPREQEWSVPVIASSRLRKKSNHT